MAVPTVAKAKEIKRHGEIRGEPLTPKQEGFFGLIAGGGRPTRLKRRRRRRKRLPLESE